MIFYCKDFFIKLFNYRSKVGMGLINKFSVKTLETFNYNHSFNNNQFIKNLCLVVSVSIFLYFCFLYTLFFLKTVTTHIFMCERFLQKH